MSRLLLSKLAAAGAIALAVAFPWISARDPGSSYLMVVAQDALLYSLLALGLNIVVGFAGLLVLGFIAFYAVGAYSWAFLGTGQGPAFWIMLATVAAAVGTIWVLVNLRAFGKLKAVVFIAGIIIAHQLFIRIGLIVGLGQGMAVPFWVALPLAGIAAALFGLLLGLPTLRLRGDYLAIVTLGFGEIVQLTLKNLSDITGAGRAMVHTSRLYLLGGLALAGAPPLNGFISKLAIVQGGIEAHSWLILGLAVSAGLITLLYMVRTWQHIFQRPPNEAIHLKPAGDSILAPALLVGICVLLGLYAAPLVNAASIAVSRISDPHIYIRGVLGG